MKTRRMFLTVAVLSLCVALPVAFAGDIGAEQKAKVNLIIRNLKDKAQKAKPVKYEVALPVATAGARGAEMKQADRFAVMWPTNGINPLTALAENLRCDIEREITIAELKAQIAEFKKTYPEFAEEKLIKDLEEIFTPPVR